MITEDYVSFETAKLLKEKGFDEATNGYYPIVGKAKETFHKGATYRWNYFSDRGIAAPTRQMAMKWLREVYNLHIAVIVSYHHIPRRYEAHIMKLENIDDFILHPQVDFDSYEEACEEAIKYCLKNLIKNEDEEEKSDIPVPKTVNEAISTLDKILSKEDRDYLLENGAISMHDSLGRWIRNEWGLWTGSELKDELLNMNKGLNHPDDMSNYIIEEFIKYWNNKNYI